MLKFKEKSKSEQKVSNFLNDKDPRFLEGLYLLSGLDGTRTRDPLRDRQVF